MRAWHLAMLAPVALLCGCGLRPVYGGGPKSVVGQTLSAIDVAPIEGKAGWLMVNALNDRLNHGRQSTTQYRLVVKLDDQITGFGIRSDDAITRERRSLRARYQLVDAASGEVLLDATSGSDAGIDIVSSEYATIAAEQSALENLTQRVADQIVTRIALHAKTLRAQDLETRSP